jgi:hypothetical protein
VVVTCEAEKAPGLKRLYRSHGLTLEVGTVAVSAPGTGSL